MRGVKGFARDRKNKGKVKRTPPSSVTSLDDDTLDRVEYEILDRKARRREALAEKRKCRRETRAANQALKNAAKLQRTIRELQKEVPPQPVPCTSPSLELVTAALTAAVDAVVVEQPPPPQSSPQPLPTTDNDWEDLGPEPIPVAAATPEPPLPSAEREDPPTEPPGTLQRLKNWLW